MFGPLYALTQIDLYHYSYNLIGSGQRGCDGRLGGLDVEIKTPSVF